MSADRPTNPETASVVAANAPQKHAWILIAWMLQILIPLRLINDLGEAFPAINTAAIVLLCMIVGAAIWPRSRLWIDAHRKQLALAWGSMFFTFVLLETSLSVLFKLRVIDYWTTDFALMVYENSDRTLRFDPVRGCFLATTPSRFTRVVEGEHEYVGVMRGNAQGFPDRDDFEIQRKTPEQRRIAVFGDSFTAAQYLERSWPDAVEDRVRPQGTDLELLNFSVDGGGLINWWSVLTRHLPEAEYDLDGIIFAVYADDLSRRFFIADHEREKAPLIGRIPFGDPSKLPTTFEQARPHLSSSGIIVATDVFERILAGANIRTRYWSPYLLTNYDFWVRRQQNEQMLRVVRQSLKAHPLHKQYVTEIHDFIQQRQIPVLVVHVPQPEELLAEMVYQEHAALTQEFAKNIGAEWLDGCVPYRDLKPEQIRENWFQSDPHWNQQGSDRFAEFVAKHLLTWPRELFSSRN
ncbi:MAG: hypothetical protein ACKVT0_02840 [Planctomycetaceae bacterium]